VTIPEDAGGALLFELELPQPICEAQVEALLAGDGPLPRLVRLLEAHEAMDGLVLALPQDEARQRALRELRAAVPGRVNEWLTAARRRDGDVEKLGGDVIVPCERVAELVGHFERACRGRGLAYAIWGHLSDGNLHPNLLAHDGAEVRAGRAILLGLAEEAVRLGGCPLAEHGVGRNALKQEMLRRFLGDGAIGEMRRIKRGLDPGWRFAPGVLFPP
jgi:D-lactate dehydrogenase (cytochrome)